MTRLSLLFVVLCLSFLLIACEEDDLEIRVLVPYGSPQLSLLYVQDDLRYDVDVVHGPDALLSAFSSKSHDVIVAPISLGARIGLENDAYPLLAIITWGNLYLATTDTSVQTLDDLTGRSLILFGQQQVPDLVTRHILDQNGIESDVAYVDSAVTASQMMMLDEARAALVAEPMLSVLRSQKKDLVTIDLQEHYQEITEHDYPQAGVFIARDLDRDTVSNLERDLMQSIRSVNEKPLESALLGVNLGFDVDSDTLAHAIPGSNISYVSARDSKRAIERFLDIFPVSPDEKPDDAFYYE
jgi:NitT/TauT family transport system substrate-binding protein